MSTPSLQDYSLIDTAVIRLQEDLELADKTSAFYYFVMQLLLGLQPDEVDDAITDNNYQRLNGKSGGHDRGIDALFVDSSTTPPTVHILTFKFAQSFEKTTGHYPSAETDKILNYVHAIMRQDRSLQSEVNPKLFQKTEEIWGLFRSDNPAFVIHICTNYFNSLEPGELSRFERELQRFANFSLRQHTAPDLVRRITRRGKQTVDCKIRAIDYNHFEKTDGDVRAVVFCADAREVLRMVVAEEALRKNCDLSDYTPLASSSILEDAFEDNVRIYLTQRSNINRNIMLTALSEENHRFFYFNNGVTLTCRKYRYQKLMRNPIIEIDDLQVVNGSQTIHALFEAFKSDPQRFRHVELLCRVYETDKADLSGSIAEYTNSQNPVESRDIRSNDFVQRKLEKELALRGFYYERKAGMHAGKPARTRIDAEKSGQVLLAMYHSMPAEAKDNKKLIFGEKYGTIFHQDLTADQLLLALQLFERIDKQRKIAQAEEAAADFLPHSSYYILFTMALIAKSKNMPLTFTNIESIWSFYGEAVSFVAKAVEKEKNTVRKKDTYNHRLFFKGNRPKTYISEFVK